MTNERRGTRRPADRPAGGGGHGDFRPYRPRRPGGAPDDGERDFGARRGGDRPGDRPFAARGGRGGYAGRGPDEGGMSVRVDPRRLSLLKELAAAEGLRPGQLVQRWIEERLDAERTGGAPAAAGGGAPISGGASLSRVNALAASLSALSRQVEGLVERLTRFEASAAPSVAPSASPATAAEPASAEPVPRRRGRPPKAAGTAVAARAPRRARRSAKEAPAGERVALHDEIIAILRERGPSSAPELAAAISERGRYRPPRSAKPLDSATVNSRVSNPVYRSRFRRVGRKIELAE